MVNKKLKVPVYISQYTHICIIEISGSVHFKIPQCVCWPHSVHLSLLNISFFNPYEIHFQEGNVSSDDEERSVGRFLKFNTINTQTYYQYSLNPGSRAVMGEEQPKVLTVQTEWSKVCEEKTKGRCSPSTVPSKFGFFPCYQPIKITDCFYHEYLISYPILVRNILTYYLHLLSTIMGSIAPGFVALYRSSCALSILLWPWTNIVQYCAKLVSSYQYTCLSYVAVKIRD